MKPLTWFDRLYLWTEARILEETRRRQFVEELAEVRQRDVRIQNLAAVIAGNMVGSAGYQSGRMVQEEEVAGDAIEIAREIVKQSTTTGIEARAQAAAKALGGTNHPRQN